MPNRNLLLSSGKQTISVTLKVINSSGNAIKSEYSYQVNVTIPMPESVKIDIRCGNEAPLPPSVFFAQGESIDLRDIAEEIDVPEYTFSQPNYLRDMQDPRDIPDPQDPEPSTEALLGTTLDQLMRYSRLSGYRGDHFVNN